jgi:hypothetical protein
VSLPLEGYSIEDLHNIYAFHWCYGRKCNMVFAGISDADAIKLEKVSLSLS